MVQEIAVIPIKPGGFGSKELCGGGDLSELLRELDDEPLGTASIAQARRLGYGRISLQTHCEMCGIAYHADLVVSTTRKSKT